MTTLAYPTVDAPFLCTPKLLSEISFGTSYRANCYVVDAKPANPKKLTARQQLALSTYTDHRLGYVSGTLIYDCSLRYLDKCTHRALISLLKAGILVVYEVKGSLRSVDPLLAAHYVGADSSSHFVIKVS